MKSIGTFAMRLGIFALVVCAGLCVARATNEVVIASETKTGTKTVRTAAAETVESKQVGSGFSVAKSGEKLRHWRSTTPSNLEDNNGNPVATIIYREYIIAAWKEGNTKFARLYYGFRVNNLVDKYHNACLNVTIKRNNVNFVWGPANGIVYPNNTGEVMAGQIIPIQQDQNRIYDQLASGSYGITWRWDGLMRSGSIPNSCR